MLAARLRTSENQLLPGTHAADHFDDFLAAARVWVFSQFGQLTQVDFGVGFEDLAKIVRILQLLGFPRYRLIPALNFMTSAISSDGILYVWPLAETVRVCFSATT